MDLKKESIKGSFWNMLTMLVGQLRNFIVSLVLARLLEPESFGLIGMAMVFSGMVEAFVDFGFGNAIIQKKDISRIQLSTVFYINLMMGGVLSLIMFFSSSLVASYFDQPQLVSIIKVMSFTFIIKALDVIPAAIFKRNIDYKTPFKIQLITGIGSSIVGIILAFRGWGVWALVYSQILGWIVSVMFTWYYVKWVPSLVFSANEIRGLWNFGYKYSISVFIDQMFNKADTLIIGKMFSATALGLFYRAQSLNRLVIQYSFSSFSGVLFPSLSKLQNDIPELKRSVIKIFQFVCYTTFFFSGIFYLCAEDMIVILYGQKWLESAIFFRIIGVFSFCFTMPAIFVSAINSIGKVSVNLKVEILKKILLLMAIPVGLKYGIYGYVIAVHVAATVGLLLNMYMMKYINLSCLYLIRIFIAYLFPFVLCLSFDYIFPIQLDNIYIDCFMKMIIFSSIYIVYNYLINSEGQRVLLSIVTEFLLKRFNLKNKHNISLNG